MSQSYIPSPVDFFFQLNRDFLHILVSSCGHSFFLVTSSPRDTFVTVNRLTLTHHSDKGLQFTLVWSLAVVHSVGLDIWVLMHTYPCNISSVLLPYRSSVVCLFILCYTLNSVSHWSFYCLHSFNFARMFYYCSHIVGSLFRLVLSLNGLHLRLLHVFSWFDSLISFLFSILFISFCIFKTRSHYTIP